MAEIEFTPEQARLVGDGIKRALDRHSDELESELGTHLLPCLACKITLEGVAQIPIFALIEAGVLTVAPSAAVVEIIVAALGGIGIDVTVDAVALALSAALVAGAEAGAAVVIEDFCKRIGACS